MNGETKVFYDPSKGVKKSVERYGEMILYEVIFTQDRTKWAFGIKRIKGEPPKYEENVKLKRERADFNVKKVWYDKKGKKYYYESLGILLAENVLTLSEEATEIDLLEMKRMLTELWREREEKEKEQQKEREDKENELMWMPNGV